MAAENNDTLFILTSGFTTSISGQELPPDSVIRTHLESEEGSLMNRMEHLDSAHRPNIGFRERKWSGDHGILFPLESSNCDSFSDFKKMLNARCLQIGDGSVVSGFLLRRILRMVDQDVFSFLPAAGEWEILIVREDVPTPGTTRRNFELVVFHITRKLDTVLERTVCRKRVNLKYFFASGFYDL